MNDWGDNLNEAYNRPVDYGDVEAAHEASLPPKGDYYTNPDEYPLFVGSRELKESEGTTRRILTLSGPAYSMDMRRVRLQFEFSPDKRFRPFFAKDEVTGKWVVTGRSETEYDSLFRRWAAAARLYKDVNQKPAATESEVIAFLQTYPVCLQVYHRNGEIKFGDEIKSVSRR